MIATSFLLILIGLFVILNSTNFVGVLQRNKKIKSTKTKSGAPDAVKGAKG